jgi:hypothetical protein
VASNTLIKFFEGEIEGDIMLSEFLTTTFVDVRSARRTDELHDAILSELLDKYPRYKKYKWEFEYNLKGDAFGGAFKVDILGFKNGLPKVAILCKCNNSNIGKNIYNFTNTTIGESARLMYSEYKFEKILFVSVYPRKAPLFKKDGSIRSFDTPYTYKERVNSSRILHEQYGNIVEEVNIFYDIENLESKKSREDFYKIIPKNITEIELKYE